MLTETQERVLVAINDHCEINGRLLLGDNDPLPDLLAGLGLTVDEVHTAAGDLHDLGMLNGIKAMRRSPAPVRIDGLTAKGRQSLPMP